MNHRILLIDDSPLDLEGLEFLLENNGFRVTGTTDGEHGIALVKQSPGAYSVAIVDYCMPGSNGAKVAERLSLIDSKLQIATYSGDTSADAFNETLQAGSQYFIPKGLDPQRLLAIIKMLCGRFEAENQIVVADPVSEADFSKITSVGLIGRSHHLVEVANLIRAYGPQDETVLITGENGTGKERVARALHNTSQRRGPFIPVNCGAIPEALLESELFGHEKGAFSGALKAKVGLVTAANAGTLFLDEIGDMPLHLQVKLLRFLQEGEVRPIGNNNSFSVTTRVIVATNVDLEDAIASGKFRQDLFYRIKGLPIELLPLRMRPEDIKPLVIHFAKSYALEKGIEKEFLEETVRTLTRYEWPGNIRELENEVRRAMLLAPESKVVPTDIDPRIRQAIELAAQARSSENMMNYQEFKERQRIRNEREERNFLLERAKGARTIREFAEATLGVSFSTLHGRLKALGIEFKPRNKGGKV